MELLRPSNARWQKENGELHKTLFLTTDSKKIIDQMQYFIFFLPFLSLFIYKVHFRACQYHLGLPSFHLP